MSHSIKSFISSLDAASLPEHLSPILQSLWYAGKDNWQAAHDIIEKLDSIESCWVHAYLHRVEGDQWNAGYWYRRAGKPMPEYSLSKEWRELVDQLVP